MKVIVSLVLCLVIVCTGCTGKKSSKWAMYYSDEGKVDFSELLDIYDKALNDSDNMDFDAPFYVPQGGQLDLMDYMYVLGDTAFAIQLPQYADSKHPFLSRAEVAYNAALLLHTLNSNYELSCLDAIPAKEVADGIRSIDESCIRDEALRQAAKVLKDSTLILIGDTIAHSVQESPVPSYLSKVNEVAYQMYHPDTTFMDSLFSLQDDFLDMTQSICKPKEKSDAHSMILKLNACRTFEEQCSLFLNWANSGEAHVVDSWVVAVAERLLNSGKYSVNLACTWRIWRCLFQHTFGGASRYSGIPNDMYNEMRKKCYQTCLKRIATHPDDKVAQNNAALLLRYSNLLRCGDYPYGNDAIIEMYKTLPQRFPAKDESASTEEEETWADVDSCIVDSTIAE